MTLCTGGCGKIEESESLVRTIMAKAGPSATALNCWVHARMASQDPEQARRHFEQAVILSRRVRLSLLQLADPGESGRSFRGNLLWERASAGGKN